AAAARVAAATRWGHAVRSGRTVALRCLHALRPLRSVFLRVSVSLWLSWRSPMPRGVLREMLAEFFGTFILIVFGVGVVAQVVLSKSTAGTFLSINIAWGLAVTMGCYVSAGVTGAHLNPAVTLALAVRRAFPWHKVAPYALAQIAGAFAASAGVFLAS